MKVYLLQNVKGLGHSGQIVKVTDGYARNFLIPGKVALEVTPANEKSFTSIVKTTETQKEVAVVKTSQLAEKIKSLDLVLKRKIHDGGKLYGAVSAGEIVELMAEKGVNINKSQVDFDKSIKTKGSYDITIRLSSSLQPVVKLKIVQEENKD